jgi:tripartite ATP-independent transporter DctM subunit
MEWSLLFPILVGSVVALMAIGVPVAFAFLMVNVVGVFVFWGGAAGMEQLMISFYRAVGTLALLPIPLFILMGILMFESGIGSRGIFVLEKWVGRLPGRLSILAIGAGALFGAVSGNSSASTALLGTTLIPEMEKAGYKKAMTIGPVLGGGSLDPIIPPSDISVVFAALAGVNVAKLLMAGFVPGLMLAGMFVIYIFVRIWRDPSLAPTYELKPTPLSEKIVDTIKYVVPFGLVIFAVMGVMILGIATPSEAASTGALSVVILSAFFGKLNWLVIKRTFLSLLDITVMVFMIILSSTAFTQILAFSGASSGMADYAAHLPVSPIVLVIIMQVVVLVLGCFMGAMPIMMLTIPIFFPVLKALGVDTLWFGIMYVINLVVGQLTPPFGFLLFVMKGVAPPGTTMRDIVGATFPYILMEIFMIGLIMVFPQLVITFGV